MWKEFFYYTKSERRVLLLLLLIACVLLVLLVLRRWKLPVSPVSLSDSAQIDSFLLTLEERDSIRMKRYEKSLPLPVVLKTFDPNTADSLSLRQLGLPSYVVRNILRYRAKGGVFRNADSFSKIYGLTSEQFAELKPYIVIADVYKPSMYDTSAVRIKEDTMPQVMKYPVGTVIDLNKADTASLKCVPGIGSGIARMIVAYRERLGGFYSVSQLQEIAYVDTSMNKWFRVDGEVLRKLSVNESSLEKLRNHPYMNFYKAKVIVEYRRKRGKIKSLSQLSMFEEFTEKDLERLAPYFLFE